MTMAASPADRRNSAATEDTVSSPSTCRGTRRTSDPMSRRVRKVLSPWLRTMSVCDTTPTGRSSSTTT